MVWKLIEYLNEQEWVRLRNLGYDSKPPQKGVKMLKLLSYFEMVLNLKTPIILKI